MANFRNRFPARRRFLKQSTALTATMMALPHLAGAKPAGEPVPKNDSDAATGTKHDSAAEAPQQPARVASARRLRGPKP